MRRYRMLVLSDSRVQTVRSAPNPTEDTSVTADSTAAIGRPAPPFDLRCTDAPGYATGGRVRLADFRGSWLLLAFYPRDFSFVCPTELTALSAHHEELDERGCRLVGVSVDPLEIHEEWLATPTSRGGLGPLRFPLASDPGGAAARAYGVFLEDKRVAARGLFFIDPDGVLQAQVVHNLDVGRNIDEVLRVLDALCDGGLCPVSWTLGDGTIDPSLQLEPGRILGRYRIRRQLGQGGFGMVFEAFDLWLERSVALKVLQPGLKADVDTLLREARAAAALNHPNICTVHAVDREDGLPVIAMEYLRGRTLAELLGRGPLRPEETRAVAKQMAEGLAASHAEGVVHGDLKPANVMLTDDGVVKLLDFGVARRMFPPQDDEETADSWVSRRSSEDDDEESADEESQVSFTGTLAYLAPERLDGNPHAPPGDVFAFGLLLYEMITGDQMLAAEHFMTLVFKLQRLDPGEKAAGLPAPFDEIVVRCLDRDPANRPRASELPQML